MTRFQNINNYITSYNRINRTNYRSILQIPNQRISPEVLQNLQYIREPISKPKKSFIKFLRDCHKIIQNFRAKYKAFGVTQLDLIKTASYAVPLLSVASFIYDLKSQTHLATVPVKERNSSKVINADLVKLDFGEGNASYVLKNKNRQLGHIDITKKPDNKIYIAFLTNITGRKKYKNIENILIQAMVEDSIKDGIIPNIEAIPADISTSVLMKKKGCKNETLYKRLGMVPVENSRGYLQITSEKVLESLKKRIKLSGEIIQGTTERIK